MSIYDPTPDVAYAICGTCDITLPTEADGNAHMDETIQQHGGRSHQIRITNPTRERRIRRAVGSHVADAVDDACNEFERMVERGDVTAEEITEAIAFHPDFADAWDEYLSEIDS